MPDATEMFKDRKPGAIGISTRASAAPCTAGGTPALSEPMSSVSRDSKRKSGSRVAPVVVSSTSRPGRRARKDSKSTCRVTSAAAALMLALADLDTPVWLDEAASNDAVQSWLRFHCGCTLVGAYSGAAFALITDAAELDLTRFEQGTMEYPDRSATLFIQVASLDGGREYVLTGPGIRDTATLRVEGLPEDFAQRWRRNAAAFPLGVDVVFCCGNRIAALPRTTQVTERT